ncbi:dystonin isoform 16-T16 [Anomaloglossus baeobatrachus]|uniref:dystonin isoform X15 n=1 Tax=Anomaloglossus baeobatrachus TaxID=238106 RepID=UPI003F4F6CA9
MIAAAFLVLLRPYSIQCALLLLLLMLGTVATISFLCCWHRKLQKGRHPMKTVFSYRPRSRGRTYALLRSHHFRSEGFRPSPRHLRRYARARVEETKPLDEIHQTDHDTSSPLRKRKIKRSSRVQPEFYQSVQVTPTRKPSSGTASYRCSMSSSADFSDDEDYSQKSGSASPAPGDTLPWNLPRHERCKRKSSGAAVLDPAERAVLRIADERDKVQKKTFTKWINQHLMKVRKHVGDLYEDLRDGHNLISLLEVLSGDTLPRERDFLKTLRLVSPSEACEFDQHEEVDDEDKGPREKGRMRFHRLQNVQIALDYLKKRQVKLVNIRNDDITDGNPKLTLGLIWTIILHFQISDIHVTGESEDMSAKEKLLLWTQQAAEGYGGIRCENFTTCWRDGRLFNAIIHRYRPDLIDMDTVAVQSNIMNLENAFYVAEKLGVTRLLDPEDVDVSSPDEKSVITYVSSMYDVFPKTPDGGEGISANDVEVKWIEYQNMVNYLIQWIRHHVTLMSDRNFPNTVAELKALYNQYLLFKEKDIPPKETEKEKIKHLYSLLEAWIEFGRIKLCQGYHPNDIEKEWGKLIIAMFEREKAIRPEIERQEMLQQIAIRVQRDSLGCEDKLILARSALQADTKRMESGIQFQNEAEIAGYLIECENLLRQQLVDVQALVDGKYYQADQLVQRVASLRDELLGLRNEYSSLYSKGRMVASDQTQFMLSGISQSLNSGFSQSLNPVMNSAMSHNMAPMSPTGMAPSISGSMSPALPPNLAPGLPSSLTTNMSHGFNSHLTPMTPTFTPNFNPGLIQNYASGMNSNALQSLKLMQVKKPLLKSSFADQNLPDEEVNVKFVQDLSSWVEEMQIQLDRGEWGSELSSIEMHLENHKNFHGGVEEFETSLKEAKMSELQMSGPLKSSYSDMLSKVEGSYSKLMSKSRNRQKHLESLHSFVTRATRELIWLNEKEEEEVAYDWSDRNQNIPSKKEYHGDLMRELDHKEEVIKSVQDTAEQLLLQNHPARSTIEAYKAATQTQWNWILQLCSCVEQHIRQNTVYFEYFSDAKDATDYLKILKDSILRKYSCDKSTSVHKLEDLVQESMEEKEQLLNYKSTVASLVGRAKAVVQLKPRNPDNPLKASVPIRAICDYRQIEITIYKDDECVLASNSHRAKWKVISPTGNEAMVPSVCFTVPAPNKEAVDSANRIEQMYQSVMSLWHESHINMKSMVSWHYLMNEIEAIRGSKVSSIKTLLPGEHQQVQGNLKTRFDEFLEDSQDSKMFSVSDIGQLEREVNVCKLYYEELLKSAEREEQEESVYNMYTSEIRNFRLRLESSEERLIRHIRTPLDRDDLHESALRISDQEKLKKDLDHLRVDLSSISDKCEEFFSQAAASPSIDALRSELNIVIQSMSQIYSMSSIYLEKLKTINLVLKNTQGAETLVKTYETKLCEEDVITADRSSIDRLIATLKQWRSEVDEKREVFHALEDGLQKAKSISDQMFKVHKERDLDFDWHKEKADQIAERWQNVHSQIENRLRDLGGISTSLKYYKESYLTLDSWIRQVEEGRSKLQDGMLDSKALNKRVDQQKNLISEIEMKQSKMDECQKYSEQYSLAIKDYELQLMTYRALVDSHQKSPMKRRRFQSSSDIVIQEYMDLRTRYSALMTLINQFVKFSGDTLKRMEEEEKSLEEEKKEHVKKAGDILNWVSNVTKRLSKEGGDGESTGMTPTSKHQISSEEILTKQNEISDALQTLQLLLAKHGDRMTEEERAHVENQIKALQESHSLLSKESKRQQQEAKELVDKLVEQKATLTLNQYCQTLSNHLTDVRDQKLHFDNFPTLGDSLEALKLQLEQLESFKSRLAVFSVTMKKDVQFVEQFLTSVPGDLPVEHLKELSETLMNSFATVCEMSSDHAKQIAFAEDAEMDKLAKTHRDLLNRLQVLADWITSSNETLDISIISYDVDVIKQSMQSLKALSNDVSEQKVELETTAFDIQFFISEHAQDLSPNQSKQLLRSLNATQKMFQDAQKRITSHTESLNSRLLAAQDLSEQKDAEVQLQEHKDKLQEINDLLTQTENRLIGQQDILTARDNPADLQHCQAEYEEVQKDVQAGASELAEIVKNTEKFLLEYGDKLSPEEKFIIEQKLKEAKAKFDLLRKKAEQSKKELEKAVTTAIKKETEKSAAVEQLEESKNKIESLLDWLSRVDDEGENGNDEKKANIKQNGTHHKDSEIQSILDGVQEVNGNLIVCDGKSNVMNVQDQPKEEDLNSQYQKVKAQHEKIVSQHQAVIIATQSAQALLEKQGRHLTPEEKEKLQKNIEALKAQYESTLCDSERKMKMIQTVQEELEKFTADCSEFVNWLHDSKHELGDLECGAEDFAGLKTKLQRQKSFSEDVLSHKGDLRYITISGQRVLDAARSCSKDDEVEDNNNISTMETCKMVQSKLDMASENYKSLHTKCNILGNNLKDLVDKYEHYKEASCGLLVGLQKSETAVQKRLSEPIAPDTRNLQRQIEDTKLLCEQLSIHQVGVEKLRKAAEGLLNTKVGLLLNKDEIQKPLDDIVERHNHLSQSVSDWNEKLQITLTRSLSVQDGLDEMVDWMQSVEKDLKDHQQVPLNSSAIQEIISKNNMLEQDITSRQSSINAMNDKVKKFMETADSPAASSLKGKMDDLSVRFSKATEQTRARSLKMEDLKTKVEQFEDVSGKVHSFLDTTLKALTEAEGPGKDVTELSHYVQETSNEILEQKKSLEELHKLVDDLCVYAVPGDKVVVLEKVNSMVKRFEDLEETIKAKEEDVSSCQAQMDSFQTLVQSLKQWFSLVNDRIPAQSLTLCLEDLSKHLSDMKNLQEEWTLKRPDVQRVNSKGTALCSLISVVTSPAKTRSAIKSGRSIVNESVSPNVKENLTNKELAVVQQGMLDVNEGYDHLGNILKNKVCDLEGRLSQLQQVHDETNSLIQWLKKMHSTATAWEAPTDSESVRTQAQQHKLFAEEVKQNESKVEALKDKLKELIETNGDVSESQNWKDKLDKIEFSWKDITQMTAERQQTLEESSNDLTLFQNAEAQLKQWLIEKELMASVLGPLSIDPNMLKTQKQQVQILLKEFDARKQQYEQLNNAGQRILSRPGDLPACDEAVKEQIADVACKWESLTGQLNDRCDRIDQAIVKSTDYQSHLNGLSEKLSALNNKLSSNTTLSSDPNAVKLKLETAQQVQEEIKQEMANIERARELCDELSRLVAEEYLKVELNRQMDNIAKPFMDLKQKTASHIEQLQSTFASSQKFCEMSEDFEIWIEKQKKEQKEAAPISTKLDVLKSLITETKQMHSSLNSQRDAFGKVMVEGEKLLQKTEGEDRIRLQSQLSLLKSEWEDVNKQITERTNNLKDCQQKAIKYKHLIDNILPWVEEHHNKVCELKLSVDAVAIEKSISDVKAIQKSVDKQRGMLEMLNSATDSLLASCQVDKEVVTDESSMLNNKMEFLIDNLHTKKDCLENMALRLKDFQESVKECENQLLATQEHLEIHESLGAQACSNKHLTIMQTQQKALQALTPQVERSQRLAQKLVVEAFDAEGVSDLLLQAESLQQKHKAISEQIEEKCSFLETKLQGIGHFQNSIREMFAQFAELDDELDSLSPIGRDRDILQAQKQEINTLLQKLGDLITTNDNANKTCKMMLATETSPDLIGIKRDLEALNKQCKKLLDRAKSREENIEDNIVRIEEFYSTLRHFINQLETVEQNEESQGTVGMETDVINQQLSIFTTFQKEEIEPLQARLQDVNWIGQGLVQSAAKNTSTQNLEQDLEEVNTRWNTLNKKVAQRAAQLQEALLHCGRFQDALESILSWLTDTEELVANQKSPSAEYKVVKAQIQEQKLLQRLLDDRKPTIDVIKREGEKISGTADHADKDKMLKQLSALERRWDELLKKAEIRNRQLDGILVVAKQFHDTLEPLSDWLSNTEKKLANSEPIGTQTPKLLEQIAQHKALQDDITAHNTILHQSLSIGQSLKALSSREEKEMVQEKLDVCQNRFMEIQERSSRRGELLHQAHCNAQIFGDDEVELMNWLTEAHDKLSKLSVQDHSTDVLTRQHTELLLLQEDILLRKQNVDQAIQNGLELLKHTTGDEVVIIQEKLDGIKSRYSEITKLGSDVSKVLEQALNLATQFHSSHNQLGRWLDKVELELKSYETQDQNPEEINASQQRKKELQVEARSNKALLDSLNEVSSSLLELVPWRARGGLDRMVTEDNERYRSVSDTLTQMVEEIDAARLRSQQFSQAVGAERTWIEDTKNKMMALGHIRLEQDQTTTQLQVQKGFTMEILRHKDTIDELVKSGQEIVNSFNEEEKEMMLKKLTNLVKSYDNICHLNAERNLQLERAVSLVNQFWETYEELWPWLTETEKGISELPAPALDYDTLKEQQEDIRQLRELIAEHKPHIDKMNKTGPQLLELSPEEGFFIQEKYVTADTVYSDIKEVVKKRAIALEEAISQSSQFHDKIEPTLESLQRIAERLRQPPSISAECEKIREQISDNKNVSVELEKLQPVYETLKMRGEEMIARSEGADKDISAKAVQDKLDQMVFIWEDIQALTEEREAQLLDVMELAEKFWCDHIALLATIKDTQEFIRELDEPGVDPSVVKQQQEAAEAIKEEIDGLQEELDVVTSLGSDLITACGEPDKPVVNKNIDELNSAWEMLNKTWKDRVHKLDDAMQAAVQYQDGLQALFDWVDIAMARIEAMPPIGTDLETVKQQITELKQFKTEAYQQQIELERLNHQKELLEKKATDENDKLAVEDSFKELKYFWQSLEDKIINRQHKLEGALLALGPFQNALDELLTWMTHTEGLLNDQKAIGGDPKTIEIELAKHHVLQNDVLAHKSSVETVQKAGNDLIASSAGEEASSLQSRLEALGQRWQNVLDKTEQRRKQLDSALFQAQGFHNEIEEMHQWLSDTERHLLASKPVGGLPETAKEQLDTHLDLCATFEDKEHVYNSIMHKSQQMMQRCLDEPEANMDQDINNLKDKWESVETKLSERKVKLEEALSLATGFHNSLQDFINWLTQAEQTLTIASPPSLILDTVLFQIDEHKVFVTEVNSHRDQIMELDKTGTHIKYFSQKQDVVLIKNLLISVQNRWENVVQRSLERGRALDDARKRSKQFHDAFTKLMEWLEESETCLDSELEIANDPDKLKTQLTQHKEFQKTLGAKHSVYDTTTRSGRSLKEKATLSDDIQKLDDMLSEIRDKWDTVCGKSVERQNKLEEALLFSGQFTDALQALIDWLYRVEPQLAEDQPVHGDIDIVMNLLDNHKVFQKELGKRSSSIQALKRSARELIEGSRDDSSWVKAQMQELGTRWETVCTLSVSKQTRLEDALHQAEEFHAAVHTLLEWLAEAEQALRFHGLLPDDEESLKTLIDQHKEFMRKVEEKRSELIKGASMGEAILTICHPDSITTIKHWITIIKARFEEVLTWAKQHQQRLTVALEDLVAKKELLESLLQWLQWAETTLNEKNKEEIPEEIDEVKALIEEHQTFMEEMTRKQPDVDKVTKTYKRKAAESTSGQSQIPVFGKGRTDRKRSPTPSLYPSGSQTSIETKNPRVNLLVGKWQQVWLLALERRRNLNDALDRLEELREFANFDFDIWRKKYMRWMNHKKSRVMDFFRRIDKDQDGKITRQEFIEGILSSKFPTSRLEMSAVADIFDRDGDGYIDYYEFVAALHPNKDAYKPVTDADKIEDEVTRQVAKCKCAKRFQVEQIGENKYRFFLGNQFGDSQQLRLVRILRSTVMVRVGGGWMALDEFLVKNDPCRVHHHGSKMLRSESNSSITTQPLIAKGRTNIELREKFMLPEGISQSMTPFRAKGRRSRPSSRGASPNRSSSSPNVQACPSQATGINTPKTPLHITRNYGKPWLTNSKTTTPCKSPECPDQRLSSEEGTPIQGSKLRLPGYLSGKGFHSTEESTILTTAASKVRTQFAEIKKTPSRAGSKAGSRSSSRRGSDASDFDISEIQSVCSDMSETVHDSNRPSPRVSSRTSTGRPSKIPTPQRRTPISKLATKSTKR